MHNSLPYWVSKSSDPLAMSSQEEEKKEKKKKNMFVDFTLIQESSSIREVGERDCGCAQNEAQMQRKKKSNYVHR